MQFKSTLRVVSSMNKFIIENSFEEVGDLKAMVLKISCKKMLRLWFSKWDGENDVWLIEPEEGSLGWRVKGTIGMILKERTFCSHFVKAFKKRPFVIC